MGYCKIDNCMTEKENFNDHVQVQVNHTNMETFLVNRKVQMKSFYRIKDYYLSSLNYLFMNLKKFSKALKKFKCKLKSSKHEFLKKYEIKVLEEKITFGHTTDVMVKFH